MKYNDINQNLSFINNSVFDNTDDNIDNNIKSKNKSKSTNLINDLTINIEFISNNLSKVFTINSNIIRLLTEEAETFNKVSMDQMVTTRNTLIKSTLELIEQKNIKLQNNTENLNVDELKQILSDINQQELQINTLFEKNLDNLKNNIETINKLNKLKIYKQN